MTKYNYLQKDNTTNERISSKTYVCNMNLILIGVMICLNTSKNQAYSVH